jgi:hypothetical protein
MLNEGGNFQPLPKNDLFFFDSAIRFSPSNHYIGCTNHDISAMSRRVAHPYRRFSADHHGCRTFHN